MTLMKPAAAAAHTQTCMYDESAAAHPSSLHATITTAVSAEVAVAVAGTHPG